MSRQTNSMLIIDGGYVSDHGYDQLHHLQRSATMYIRRRISDVNRCLLLLLLLILSFSYLFLFSFSSLPLKPFSTLAPLRNQIYTHNLSITTNNSYLLALSSPCPTPPLIDSYFTGGNLNHAKERANMRKKREELANSKIAVCLVGGARLFELTGPSIIENILKVYPNADMFLNSPLDQDSLKLWLLKDAPRLTWVRIFEPKSIAETKPMVRVLTPIGSPNGMQGLLQYFNLVEGCITMIEAYQNENNFTYDWIIRTRVDGYWSNPLDPEYFMPGKYVVPSGSSYAGLNDRFGVGDLTTSKVALSRLSLIADLNLAGLKRLNSESAFKAQLTTHHVPYVTKHIPFCIVTDRTYDFPPSKYGMPVAALSSRGPLNGVKCRPCTVACSGSCIAKVMGRMDRGWGWTEWKNGTMELCNTRRGLEKDWDKLFDDVAGEKLARARKLVGGLDLSRCMEMFDEMKRMAVKWEAPASKQICMLGLRSH